MSAFVVHHYVCHPIKSNFHASLPGNLKMLLVLPSVHYLLSPFIAFIDGDFELRSKIQVAMSSSSRTTRDS